MEASFVWSVLVHHACHCWLSAICMKMVLPDGLQPDLMQIQWRQLSILHQPLFLFHSSQELLEHSNYLICKSHSQLASINNSKFKFPLDTREMQWLCSASALCLSTLKCRAGCSMGMALTHWSANALNFNARPRQWNLTSSSMGPVDIARSLISLGLASPPSRLTFLLWLPRRDFKTY